MRFPILSMILVAALSATTQAQTFDDDDDGFGAPEPAPAPAAAPTDEAPRFSIGAARALAGVAGPAGSFGATDALEIDAIVGIAKFSGDMAGPTSALGVEVGVRWLLVQRGPTALSAGIRAGLTHSDTTRYLVETPVRLELAVTTWLRMHVEGGFAASYQPGEMVGGGDGGGSVTSDSTTTWRVGSNGVAAGAGFSVAF